ncbi:hypothetical protein [Boseongicola aestuarii]|uniref:Tyrosine recombinase XerC n=1 Tax=Boseongicola aestuarii TaxID=1470561 RepID=A0A238J3S6_9RHOB|nr:hypothetical protein [Boseongicola aestuarii]SMX24882.1 Tyrosine recombinase XerC [Boseongicola aestuarii]
MGHKPLHTILRGNTYYYNRRVPKRKAAGFGKDVVKLRLSRNWEEAQEASLLLTKKLDEIWSAPNVHPVDIGVLLESARPKVQDLISCMETYLETRSIHERPVRLAVELMVNVSGNKEISLYTRRDARSFIQASLEKGNKTATVRRRVQSLHAVVEFGLLEIGATQRNPFSRLTIPGEGQDISKRGVFSETQLVDLYRHAFTKGSDTGLVLPILGETGARVGEIVGLSVLPP